MQTHGVLRLFVHRQMKEFALHVKGNVRLVFEHALYFVKPHEHALLRFFALGRNGKPHRGVEKFAAAYKRLKSLPLEKCEHLGRKREFVTAVGQLALHRHRRVYGCEGFGKIRAFFAIDKFVFERNRRNGVDLRVNAVEVAVL